MEKHGNSSVRGRRPTQNGRSSTPYSTGNDSRNDVAASSSNQRTVLTSSRNSGDHRHSQSSDVSVQLWLKSDVFTFGALQVPPHSRIIFENLKKLINYARVKNEPEFPRLRFSTWRHVACDKLGMAPEVAWIYFETYDMLRDVAVPQIGKIFDETMAAAVAAEAKSDESNGVSTTTSIPGVVSGASKDEVWVDVRRFALLLGIQRIHKISLRSSLTMGDEWPTGQPPSSPRPLPLNTSRSSSLPDAETCLTFFLTYLNDFLDLLLTPISAATTTSSKPTSTHDAWSPTSPQLSLEAVESLGFLIGVQIRDRRTGAETRINLDEVATIPSLHSLVGYDSTAERFDYRSFEEWLRSSLVPDPFAFPSATPRAMSLSWIPSTSSAQEVASTNATNATASHRKVSSPLVASNAVLGPRPRDKAVYVSGVFKGTIARSDDDEHLFQAALHVHRSRDSYFYFVAPMRTALLSKCKNVTVVLGCVETTVHVTDCDNVTVVACCRRLSVAASKRCVFHVLTPTSPLLLGGYNENLTLAPFHAAYPGLNRHLDLCNIGVVVTKWNRPYVMGAVSADAEAKSWKLLDPADFVAFVIPFDKFSRKTPAGDDERETVSIDSSNPRRLSDIPGGLPPEYEKAYRAKLDKFFDVRARLTDKENQTAREADLTSRLNCVIGERFLDWMMSNGRHKELKTLAKMKLAENNSGGER